MSHILLLSFFCGKTANHCVSLCRGGCNKSVAENSDISPYGRDVFLANGIAVFLNGPKITQWNPPYSIAIKFMFLMIFILTEDWFTKL